MSLDIIIHKGRKCVAVPVKEYEKLQRLPEFPPTASDGTSDALEYARVSIARQLISDRAKAGLTQQTLAKLAGVRQETISRIESGKHSPTVKMLAKLDKALRRKG